MMYNDVVNSSENPFPGQLFNEPGGIDVYGDIIVDYVGNEVTAENFLNVIQGIQTGDTKNNKVLKSTQNDNVFIYYSDHGATGLVAMPTGDPLYSTDLIKALNNMYNNNMYNQLVFYLEACESGSMFDGVLPNNTNIFATTAATPDQPSYAFYYNDTLQTYMADEYSIRWMQDSTNNWDSYESLIQQYNNVAKIVQESQPQKYGDFKFDSEPIEDFEAYDDKISFLKRQSNKTLKSNNIPTEFDPLWTPSKLAVSSRDVKLATLQWRYLNSKETESQIEYAELIKDEINYRTDIDILFDKLIKITMGYYNGDNNEESIESIKYGHLQPTNWECLKEVYSDYEGICEDKFTDYSLKYVNILVNLCEILEQKYIISQTLNDLCE